VSRATRTRTTGAAAVAVALAVAVVALPGVAFAQAVPSTLAGVPASVGATSGPGGVPSKVVTTSLGAWALDFTLPSFGKSGCLVCHGDPRLVVPKGDTVTSYWIDQKAYDKSAHATVECAGCHLDFGYRAPHDPGAGWREIAKQSCANCHGAHDIPRVTKSTNGTRTPDPAGLALVHGQSEKMCGASTTCHKVYWDNYTDYYHGAAYKRGALDAPACWDCHGTHMVKAATDTLSPVNVEKLPATCGSGADGSLEGQCHEGSSAELAQYAPLIHKRQDVLAANPIYAFLEKVRSWFK
jgi:hypothetical protein